MLRRRGDFIYLVIFAALLNESNACFNSNEHERISMATGESFYQECQCTEPGYTIDNLKWLNANDKPIMAGGPGTSTMVFTEEQGDSINLHIPSISRSISGVYKCVTEINGVEYIRSYNVDAYEPLMFFKTPTDQHLVDGKDDVIICAARSETAPRISWKKEIEGQFVDILLGDGKFENTHDGLLVKNVTKQDAGKYKCTALVISTGEDADKFIDVEIHTVPVITELRANPNTVVVTGDQLSIDCIAEGTPLPQFDWKYYSDNNRTKTWEQKVNTITLKDIQADDDGIYECHAYNDVGRSTQLIRVEVLVAPNITFFPNITEIEGTTVQIICNATGRSQPNITILYEGKELSNETQLVENMLVPNMASVTLSRSNEGVYVCNATNEVDYDEIAMYLTVLHKPYFEEDYETIWGYEGKTVTLNCAPDSNPPAAVSWRFENNDIPNEEQLEINKALHEHNSGMSAQYIHLNIDKNTTYGIFICKAKNDLGEATKIVFLREGFKPPAVDNATIVDVTATTVTFEIEGPIIKDIPQVLGYMAQYDEKKNFEITDIHVNRTWSIGWPFKIEKLKPNTRYIVSFAAVNEVGAGEMSDEIEFETLEKSVPESPVMEEESIHRSSGGNYILKWREPDDNGEHIDYYILKYCPIHDELNEQLCEERQALTTELELGLESNTTYFLELIAHNAEGNSTPANISITIPGLEEDEESSPLLSGGVIIGISILIVVLCLVLLDLLLLAWRRQGIIAACCLSKETKKEDTLNSRDKKGLLNGESTDTRPDNSHKEFEYNKNTGIITGKHSSV